MGLEKILKEIVNDLYAETSCLREIADRLNTLSMIHEKQARTYEKLLKVLKEDE